MTERYWLFAYDIANRRRWRQIHRLLLGYGDPLQLSVFHVRATTVRADGILAQLSEIIDPHNDRIIRVDLGRPESAEQSLRIVGSAEPCLERSPIFL